MNTVARNRPAGSQDGLVRDPVVNIQITTVMRVDDVWLQFVYYHLNTLNYFNKGKRVETVIRQTEIEVLTNAEDLSRLLGGSVTVCQIFCTDLRA